MLLWLIIIIIFIVILNYILKYFNHNNITYSNNTVTTVQKPIDNSNYEISKYVSNSYIMTQTELKFYRELKKVTDKLELSIFPQVDLERIINVSDNNNIDRNRIKSRSIDFSIVNNKNCKIVCCVELDDYTHNREKVKKADEFKNLLFEQVKIPLYRVKVNKFYNTEELENMIKESLYELFPKKWTVN